MIERINGHKELLYFREYLNDMPAQTGLIKRISCSAIPVLSLHPSLRFPISLAMGSLRVWNIRDSFSVLALVGSLFNYRAGIVFTATQDLLIEIKKFPKQDKFEIKTLVKIFSNTVYLVLIFQGGLQLSTLASSMQGIVNLIQFRDEFKKGC